jgi:uncharacterized membrane protein
LNRLIPAGRLLFAAGLIALAVEHFLFRTFVVGRAPPWPASWPGGAVWAYLSGLVMLATVIGIVTGKRARTFCLTAAALVFLWALLRHIPVIAGASLLGGGWTPAGKSLVFTGGFLAIAATFPAEPNRPGFVNTTRGFILAGRLSLGYFLLTSGIQHFMFLEFVASLMPPWFPGNPVFWAQFAGVCLIAGGLGMWIPRTAGLAALLAGCMVFSWVFLVHIPRLGVGGRSDEIAVFEALAFSGIAFVIAGYLKGSRETADTRTAPRSPRP